MGVVLLGVTGTVATGGPAAATAAAPGSVISSSVVTLPSELAPYATIKRISYWSTDVRNNPITATGLVITPKVGKKNRAVAWAHGTTGLADNCAPSVNKEVFWPEARAAVIELLKRGWTVAAADYPGLGTPAAHPYLVGDATARSVIDSVKAARNLDGALSTQYVIDGHSQGGQTALFAGEIAPTYDGSLVLKGVAAIAPLSTVEQLAPLIPGSDGQGYLVMGLYGLSAVDPTFNPNSVLTQEARNRAGILQSGCLYEILAAYAPTQVPNLLVGGTLPKDVVDRLVRWDNPGRRAPSAPVLVVHGTADAAVPYFLSEDFLIPDLQAYNKPVEFKTVPGADHEEAVFKTTVYVADWIARRFG